MEKKKESKRERERESIMLPHCVTHQTKWTWKNGV